MRHLASLPLIAALSVGVAAAEDTAADCDCHTTCTGSTLMFDCGTDEADRWENPCADAVFEALPFCDESLSIDDRVSDLIARIPDQEKLGSAGTSTPLSNYATEMPSVGMRYYQWWNEALHGVATSPGVLFDETAPSATSFPQIISTSHSFNRSLFSAIGAAIGTEIRAFANLQRAGLTYWTPNLNIFRDPRWGRGQETPGEDPYLNAQYVAEYVPALQYDRAVDAHHLKVSACCKHFAAYSLEDYEGIDRHHFNAVVNDQDFADTYTPAFESCISPEQGGASCIMCSYNELNGVPTCASKDLLTTLARDTWKFEGYITSDCGAVDDIYQTHEYSSTPEQAVYDVLHAGMDTECGDWMDYYLKSAVDSGIVSMDMVDVALSNLLKIHMRLGHFDAAGTGFDKLDMNDVNTASHRQLAREAAQQSMVLLKNDAHTLPLNAEDAEKIALLGPNADATIALLGNYYGEAPYIISPLEALRKAVSTENVFYSSGCEINSTSTDGFADAVQAVERADTIVLVVGIDQSIEAEGLDRTSISLPGVQTDLIETVLRSASGKPVVMVIIGGGALCLAKYKNDPRIGAIIFAGYPGQAGGQGLADVLFGTESPSGRLSQTFYSEGYLSEVSFYDMGMRPSDISPGRGYRFYKGSSVVYEFGHGLSYTDFKYNWVYIGVLSEPPSTKSEVVVNVSVNITNSGSKYRARETALVFLEPPISPSGNVDASTPIKVLRDFRKVQLEPGSHKVLDFSLTAKDFSLAAKDGSLELVRGKWNLVVGPMTRPIIIP